MKRILIFTLIMSIAAFARSQTIENPHADVIGGGWFGYSLVYIRDIDGDGYDDIAVGAPKMDGATPGRKMGRVLFFRGSNGEHIGDAYVDEESENPDYAFNSQFYTWAAGFGSALGVLPGETPNDPDSVIVGAVALTSTFWGHNYQDIGVVVLLKPPTDLTPTTDFLSEPIIVQIRGSVDGDELVNGGFDPEGRYKWFEPPPWIDDAEHDPADHPGYGFGISVAARDSNTLIIGHQNAALRNGAYEGGAGGRVMLYDVTTRLMIKALEPPPSDMENGMIFGSSVAAVPDVTGDGIMDILVGAKAASPGAAPALAGRAYLYSGGGGGNSIAPRAIFKSPLQQKNGFFGQTVAGLADINGDSKGDVAIGAPFEDPPGAALTNDRGRVHIFSGASNLTSSVLLATIDSPQTIEPNKGNFGWSISASEIFPHDDTLLIGAPFERVYYGPGNTYFFDGAGKVYRYFFTGGGDVDTYLPFQSSNYRWDGAFGWGVAGMPGSTVAAYASQPWNFVHRMAVSATGEEPGPLTNNQNYGRAYIRANYLVTPVLSPSPTPSPTVSPSPTPSPTVSPSPTPSPTASPSPTPSPTASPTASDTPSPTETPSPTATEGPTETPTPVLGFDNVAPYNTTAFEDVLEDLAPQVIMLEFDESPILLGAWDSRTELSEFPENPTAGIDFDPQAAFCVPLDSILQDPSPFYGSDTYDAGDDFLGDMEILGTDFAEGAVAVVTESANDLTTLTSFDSDIRLGTAGTLYTVGNVNLHPDMDFDLGIDAKPKVFIKDPTTVFAVWQGVYHEEWGQEGGEDYDIFFSQSTNAGETWSTPMLVNHYANVDMADDIEPTIAAVGDKVKVMWISNDQLTTTTLGDYDIHMASLDLGISEEWTTATKLKEYMWEDLGDDGGIRLKIIPYWFGDTLLYGWFAGWHSNSDVELQAGFKGVDYDVLFSATLVDYEDWESSLESFDAQATADLDDDEYVDWLFNGVQMLAVWQCDDDSTESLHGPDYDIMVGNLEIAGEGGFSDPVPLVTHEYLDSGDDTLPVIVSDNQGLWAVLWQSDDSLNDTIGTDFDILYTTSTMVGATPTVTPTPSPSPTETPTPSPTP